MKRPALCLLLLLWRVEPSYAQRAGDWLELAKASDAVVVARVVEPERQVHRPEKRTTRITRLPDGGFISDPAPDEAFWIGNIATLRVEAVHKAEGRPVAIDQVIQLFIPRRVHLSQGRAYLLFLRPEIEDFRSQQEPFRGTTLVSYAESTMMEVPFEPGGVFGRTISVPQDDPRCGPIIAVDDKTGEELQQIDMGIQQSLDRTPPTVSFTKTPRPVVRGTEDLAVDAQDDVGISDVVFYAEHMEPGGAYLSVGLRTQPPYSLPWDTTWWPDGRYRIWAWASDLRGNKAAHPPVAVVVDNTRPTLTVTPSPSAIWPPDGNPMPVTVAVKVADRTDPAPRVRLLSIVANAPDPLAGVAGASFGEDDRVFTLAAVQGREYRVTYAAEDTAGNTVQAVVTIAIKNPAVPAATPN